MKVFLLPFKHPTLAIGLALLFLGCKEDKSIDPDLNVEDQYFADYDSPRNKWGYIDNNGNKVIENRYDDARDFIEGAAAVNYKGKWGYIDTEGNQIVEFKYQLVNDYREGMAFVLDFENKWYLIDRTGIITTPLDYTDYKSYSNGIAPVSKNGVWGLIDIKGDEVVPPSFQSIIVLNDSSFIAKNYDKYGVLNTHFDTLVPMIYDRIFPAFANVMRRKKDGHYHFYNTETGQESLEFDKGFDFLGDMTFVKRDKEWILMDKNFNEIRSFEYTSIYYGGQNKWLYIEDGLWGVLNESGIPIIEAQYDMINRFYSDRAAYMKDELWGYIDLEGQKVLDPILFLAWDYHDDLARVIDRGGFGVINKDGRLIIEPQFLELRDFYDGRARFQSW